MVRFGSVCSGIEAASVAWEPLGWEAQWFAEIEHFPSAVLAHRFPSVPNLGDMTKIHQTEIFKNATIDLLVGGTPCQSFSVAGLRKGLDDSRGGLMLTFVELAARKRPKWLVWENVPGVLSSNKGKDFTTFLGLLTGREVQPPVGGWKNSGCIGGIGAAYGVAWRVLDAQHFGVAQRRRRVFVVGYLGDWRPAAAVLFEQDSLSGNPKKSRKKRKATSADVEGGSGGGGTCWNGEQTAATLTKQNANGAQRMPDKDNLGAVLQPIQICFNDANGTRKDRPNGGLYINETPTTSPTITQGQSDLKIIQPVAHAFKVRGGSEVETGEQGGTPGKKAGTIGTTQDQQIAQPVPFRKARRAQSKDDHETWEQDEKTNTLNAFDVGDIRTTQAVVQPIAVDTYNQTINKHTTQTIGSSASDVNHYGAVLTPHLEGNPFVDTFVNKGLNYASTQERNSVKVLSILREKIGTKAFAQWGLGVFNTLQSTQILQSDLHGFDVRPATFSDSRFIYGSLSCKENGSAWLMQSLREAGCEGCTSQGWELSEQYIGELRAYLSELPYEKPQSKRFLHDLWEADERLGVLRQALSKIQDSRKSFVGESKSTQTPYAIRRLTPFETEILQGFPRGWTKIPYRNKPAEECPDGPRYKACGNSMAVPVMHWIGKRIQMVIDLLK